MTGVGDVVWAVRRTARSSLGRRAQRALFGALIWLFGCVSASFAKRFAVMLPEWWQRQHLAQGLRWPGQRRPDARETLKLMDGENLAPAPEKSSPRRKHLRWGLLLPITSRRNADDNGDGSSEQIWSSLEKTLCRLVESIPSDHRSRTRVYVGIDLNDPLYDNEEAKMRIRSMLSELDAVDFSPPLVPAYQGALCWIWAKLALRAVEDGADLFVLLGDDLTLLNDEWQPDVEDRFDEIATERQLPFGCACVAIRDETFGCFPTFPVIHRLHMEVFGQLFPPEFRNQHGDPYLFEVYRRWGASRYAERSSLRNEVGGAGEARYKKAGVAWRGDILSRGIETMENWLKAKAPMVNQVTCIDVVIPTFRCEISVLKDLCSLDCDQDASVQTILVVDRPDADNIDEVRSLLSYRSNRFVRVYIMEKNAGASAARNAGLAQSFGDHAVLLDDDVVPRPQLLDAYISAIKRAPGAAAYVGVTELPAPQTWSECAIKACNICYFYGIADLKKHVPWGVTANLCVRSRTIPENFVFFDRRFPRTGGGEDVDFCIRSQLAGHGPLIGVPAARVQHPFWNKPFKQIRGWANGDVLCLESLPHAVFRTLPNWIEATLACVIVGLSHAAIHSDVASILMAIKIAMVCILVEVCMLLPRFVVNASAQPKPRLPVALLAAYPPMLQDVVRLCSKLQRFRFSQLCAQFDWMNGTGQHVEETQSNVAVKAFVALLTNLALFSDYQKKPAITLLTLTFTTWVIRQRSAALAARVVSIASEDQGRLARSTLIQRPPLNISIPSENRPFLFLAYQRTGSNLLCSYLETHKDITMHYELFNDKAIFTGSSEGKIQDVSRIAARDTNPAGFLEEWIGKGGNTRVGFKLFPEHIKNRVPEHFEFYEQLLADPRIHKVVLCRENRLALCASMMRAAVTGHYIKKNYDDVKVHIKANEFQNFVDEHDKYYAFVRERLVGQEYVELTYEELVLEADQTLLRVFRMLGVSPESTKSNTRIKKQSSSSLKNVVVNFAELKAAFACTERAGDFED